jgi:hypothetical protein
VKNRKIMVAIGLLAISTIALAQGRFSSRANSSRMLSWGFSAPSVNGTANLLSPNRGDIAVDTSLTTPVFYGYDGNAFAKYW